MGDDFHAVIKLVSGEEIYAQASWIEEDQLLLVGNAITIINGFTGLSGLGGLDIVTYCFYWTIV